MALLKITVDGLPAFNRAFDTLGRTVSDFRPAWPEIERIFFRATLEQFDTEGARSTKWAPLSPNYAKQKARRFPGRQILVRTGRLKRSLSVIGSGGGDQIRDEEATSLTLGTRVDYAIYHQRGGRRLPARRPLEITLRDAGRMTSRLFRYAERAAGEAGFKVKGGRLQTIGDT